jgi:hypothetical protein
MSAVEVTVAESMSAGGRALEQYNHCVRDIISRYRACVTRLRKQHGVACTGQTQVAMQFDLYWNVTWPKPGDWDPLADDAVDAPTKRLYRAFKTEYDDLLGLLPTPSAKAIRTHCGLPAEPTSRE